MTVAHVISTQNSKILAWLKSVHESDFLNTIRMAYLDMFLFWSEFCYDLRDQSMARKHSMIMSVDHFDSKCCVLLPNLLLIYACVFGLSQQEIDHLEGPFDIKMRVQNIHYPM